jgi:hypothetical protein
MKIRVLPGLALSAASLLAACGVTSMSDGGDGSGSGQRKRSAYGDVNDGDAAGDAPTGSRRPAVTGKATRKPEVLDEDTCAGVPVHGEPGHGRCDSDDMAVANGDDDQSGAKKTADDAKPQSDDTTAEPATKPEEPAEKPAEPPKDPNIVEFRIAAGTGNGAWNTKAETVMAKVGQTVRIINDDSVTHRLHTNGAPCPHGPNIPAGTSFDCKVTRALDPGNAAPTYDHIVGSSAMFWVKAVQ